MVRNEKEKAAALILTALCIITYVVSKVLDGFPVEEIAIAPHCPLYARLCYSFFHASLVHCIVNCWCLLSVVFIYRISLRSLLVAYVTAVLYPIDTLAAVANYTLFTLHFSLFTFHSSLLTPTIGLSGVCFCLLGQISFRVKRKLYYHFCILSFIVFGFIAPLASSACGYTVATPNTLLHLYSYVVGLLVGFLNSPAPWQRK